MIVVDSSAWIANLRGEQTEPVRKLRLIERPSQIIVGDLILLEVMRGARDEAHAARIERDLRQFAIEPMLDDRLASGGSELSRAAPPRLHRAQNRRRDHWDVLPGIRPRTPPR
jgi:predicted nucleic acid-binding protein